MSVDSAVIRLVTRVEEVLEREGALTRTELEALLDDGDASLLDRALQFLARRDEILVDVTARRVYSRRHVVEALVVTLRGVSDLTHTALAERSGLGLAICCDVLGWMEREGRVRIENDRVILRRSSRG